MAEVGVLELKVKDNSSKAAQGLKDLAGALSTVQQNAGNSLGLGNVNEQLKQFATTLNRQKNTTAAIKNITAFGTAMSKLSAIKSAINFNTDPIKKLKTAIGDGIKITGNPAGQLVKIRDALGGDWSYDNAVNALKNIKGVADSLGKSDAATTLSSVANSVKKLGDAISASGAGNREFVGVGSSIQQAAQEAKDSSVDYMKAIEEFEKTKKETEVIFKEPVKTGRVMKLNIQQFAEKGTSGGNWRDQMAMVQSISDQAKNIDETVSTKIKEVADALKELGSVSGGNSLQSFADGLSAIASASEKGAKSYHTITYLATAVDKLKKAFDGFAVPSFQKLISLAQALQENYNAAEAMKGLASGMEAVKKASDGFAMPNVKGIEKIIAAMEKGGTAVGEKTGTAGMAESVEAAVEPMTAVVDTVQEADKEMGNLDAQASKAGTEIQELLDMLRAPIDHTKIQEYMDSVTGVSNELTHVAEESANIMNAPAMDKEGPFKYASDEILHYTELIKKAEQDVEFWSNKYDQVMKDIKYKGASEERTSMLGHAEEGFDNAVQQISEYENKIKEIGEYVASLKDELQGVDNQIKDTTSSVSEETEEMKRATDAAREEAEAIRAQQEARFYGSDQDRSKHYSLEETNKMADNLTQLDKLKAELRDAEIKYNKFVNTLGASDTKTIKAGLAVSDLRDKIWQMKQDMNDSSDKKEFIDPQALEDANRAVREHVSEIELLETKYESMANKLAEDYASGSLSTDQWIAGKMKLQSLGDKIEKLKAKEEQGGPIDPQKWEEASQAVHTYVSSIELLESKYNLMAESLTRDIANGSASPEQVISRKMQMNKLSDQIDRLKEKQEEVNATGMPVLVEDAQKAAEEFLKAHDSLDLLKQQIEELKTKLGQGLRMGTMDPEEANKLGQQIQRLTEKYTKLAEAQKKASSVSGKIGSAFGKLKDSLKSMFPHLASVGKQFVSIARRMALRAVIKQLTSGFREGVENVYHYSKAIDGSFSKSMDNAASSLLQMKNSIGAAAAPAIQALIPVLQSVVSWFTTLINYVNQFFALMSGQSTWTRALATSTEAYADSAKKAGGAANDWLADFDELNVIPSGGGGGGGGAGTPDYASMFEEVTEFDGKIKEIVGWIQEHMELIKELAIAAGVAILGWKLSSAFDGVMGTLGKIAMGAAIAYIGLQIAYEGAYEAGLNGGFDASTLLPTIAGNIASAVGGGIIGYQIAGPGGAVVGAAIGLTIGIATTIIAYKTGTATAAAKAAFASTGQGGINPQDYLDALQAELDNRTKNSRLILNAYVNVPDMKQKLEDAANEIVLFNQKVFSGDGEITDEEAASFQQNWAIILSTLNEMSTATYDTLLSGVIGALKSDNDELRRQAEEARISLIMARDNVSEARAEWIRETEDLKDKVLQGMASDEELAEYTRRVTLLAKTESRVSYADGVNRALEDVNLIDFGDKDTALESAKGFITDVGSAVNDALAKVEEAKKTAQQAAKDAKREIEELYASNLLTDEEYEGNLKAIDLSLEVSLSVLNEDESEIKSKLQDAYDIVFKQLMEAAENLGGDNKKFFLKNVLGPMMEYAERMGYSYSSDLMEKYGDEIKGQQNYNRAREAYDNVENKPLVAKAGDLLLGFAGTDMFSVLDGLGFDMSSGVTGERIEDVAREREEGERSRTEAINEMKKSIQQDIEDGMSLIDILEKYPSDLLNENIHDIAKQMYFNTHGNEISKVAEEIMRLVKDENYSFSDAKDALKDLIDASILEEAFNVAFDTIQEENEQRNNLLNQSDSGLDTDSYKQAIESATRWAISAIEDGEYTIEQALEEIKNTGYENDVYEMIENAVKQHFNEQPDGITSELGKDVVKWFKDVLTGTGSYEKSDTLEDALDRAAGWFDADVFDKIQEYVDRVGTDKFLEELGIPTNPDTQGSVNKWYNKTNMFAKEGIADVGPRGFYAPQPEVGFYRKDEEDTTTAVANGMKQGSVDVVSAIGVLQGLLRVIASNTANSGKVAIVPSSALGRSVAAGAALFANVTGND